MVIVQNDSQSVEFMIQLVKKHFFQTEGYFGAYFIKKVSVRASKCDPHHSSLLDNSISVPTRIFWSQNEAKSVYLMIQWVKKGFFQKGGFGGASFFKKVLCRLELPICPPCHS